MGSMPAGRRDWDRRFEDAALDPSQWLQVLGEFADATGSARAELVGVSPEPGQSFSWVTSVDERLMQDFVASGGHSPRSNFRIAADDGKSVLGIIDERRYDQVKQTLSSTSFVDFCEQNHMVHGCQSAIVREQGRLIGLSVLRSRSEGRTGEKERKVFAAGAVAAARAVRLQTAIENQGHHLLTGSFEAMSTPCLLIDGFGTVRSVTSAAADFLRQQDMIAVRDGRLGSRDPILDGEITRAVRAATGPAPTRYTRIAPRRGAASGPAIELFGLPRADWSMPFAIRALAVVRTSRLPADASQRLSRAFDLTPAEAEVAVLLCQGVPRDEITARRRVSSETLRSQLRALYSKMSCNREVELVLLARAVLN